MGRARHILTMVCTAASCATPTPFDPDAGEEMFWESCTAEGGSSRSGPVTITMPSDVDSLAGVAVIEGDLIINGGMELTTLAPLSDLRCVRGTLSIEDTAALRTLEGLDGLLAVERGIDLHRNVVLENVEALSSVRFVGPFRTSVDSDLSVVGNPVLTQLTGLSGVTEVRGDLTLRSTALTGLAGLEGITSVWGNVTVFGNTALETTEGLESLSIVNGQLEVEQNVVLTAVVLPELTIVDEDDTRPGNIIRGMSIAMNAQLTSVEMPSLTRAVNLEIHDNPVLTTVDLRALREMRARMTSEGDLLVSGPRLSEVSLASLTQVDDELFVYGDDLDDLAAPQLTTVGGNVRVGSPSIPRIRNASVLTLDFGALTSVGGDLIIDLTGLADMQGLANLTSVGGRLEIVNNPALNELTGLEQLSSLARGLTVRNNVVLPTCEAEELEAQLVAAGYNGFTSIAANDDTGTCP